APWDALRWAPIDLATIAAALVALRRVRFSVLGLPIAIALWALAGHLAAALVEPDEINFMLNSAHLVAAAALLGIGYLLDQRERGEDYALWFYLVGLMALAVGVAGIWSHAPLVVAHASLALSIACVGAAIKLRRRMFVV